MSKTIKLKHNSNKTKNKIKVNSKYPIEFKLEESYLLKKNSLSNLIRVNKGNSKLSITSNGQSQKIIANNKNDLCEIKLIKKKPFSKRKNIKLDFNNCHTRTKSNLNFFDNSHKESVLEKFFPNFESQINKTGNTLQNSTINFKKKKTEIGNSGLTKTLIKRENTFCNLLQQSDKKKNVKLMNKKNLNKHKNNSTQEKSSKRKNGVNKLELFPIFKNEEYIFKFLELIYKKEDIYNLFKEYIEFIQEINLDKFLDSFDSSIKKKYHKAFILERVTIMVSFYLLITKKYNLEIIFLQKLILAVYSNIYSFISLLVDLISEDQINSQNQMLIDQMINRNFNLYKIKLSKDVENNNDKILKYIELQIKTLKPDVFNSLMKILEFVDDFNLQEGFDYLLNIFSDLYKEIGVVNKEDTSEKKQIEKKQPEKKKVEKKQIEKKQLEKKQPEKKQPENEKNLISLNNTLNKSVDVSSFLSDISIRKEFVLVLDLDETLVHFQEENEEGKVYFRPYVETFLKEMHKFYEIMIFTAALKEYADPIIDYLDPEKKIITKRFYREDTLFINNEYSLKDLEKIGRDLSKVIIIDNIPENFNKQTENGIFIKSWFGEEDDDCLLDLLPILRNVIDSNTDDVRLFLTDYRRKLIEKIKRGSLNPKNHF